jgi:hypothetical protein
MDAKTDWGMLTHPPICLPVVPSYFFLAVFLAAFLVVFLAAFLVAFLAAFLVAIITILPFSM